MSEVSSWLLKRERNRTLGFVSLKTIWYIAVVGHKYSHSQMMRDLTLDILDKIREIRKYEFFRQNIGEKGQRLQRLVTQTRRET